MRRRGNPMTEAEWRSTTDAVDMLRALSRQQDQPPGYARRVLTWLGFLPYPGWQFTQSARKLALFNSACARRIWVHLDNAHRAAVEVHEKYADGLATDDEESLSFRTAEATALMAPPGEDVNPDMVDYWRHARYAYLAWVIGDEDELEIAAQAKLLRDIFGNPFRPIAVIPALQTANVVSLAQAIYDERAFDRMPILGDALEDAGCTNADILMHCRQPGEHVRGCWVVDWVLGKK
jgi:hypothetical protein